MSNLNVKRSCDICHSLFSFGKDVVNDTSHLQVTFGGDSYESWIDWVYPNLFANICPDCLVNAFEDYKEGSSETRLAYLYDLFLFLGKIPSQYSFGSLFYLYKDRESIIKLFNLITKLRTSTGYESEYGSFFNALVRSGILPKGTRKVGFGTMVSAKDGHLCLSIEEKEIDDFLYTHNIRHEKEIYYPDSSMRADWEIFDYSKRVFIEYFGLMNNKDYAEKVKNKAFIAARWDIELIELYPSNEWRDVLLKRFTG